VEIASMANIAHPIGALNVALTHAATQQHTINLICFFAFKKNCHTTEPNTAHI